MKVFLSILIILIISGGIAGWRLYHAIYQPNVFLGERTTQHIFIPTGSNFQDVKTILYENGIIVNNNTFEWLAEKKNYPNHIRPGRYLIHENMGNNELINLLRSGDQDPVMLTFNNIRLKEDLAGTISTQLEADSLSIIALLNDSQYLEKFDMTPQSIKAVFMPNTYEFFWNTSAEQFVERMYREYQSYWTDSRIETAEQLGLTPVDVATMASIVQLETSKPDEYAKIAGVYVNRIRRNMPLQADPTVIFATGDFSIRRVLNRHLETDSPYNTYKYAGLPPGPIAMPKRAVIEGVLNSENHEYLFFCAKDDFSGYHAFSRTYSQHIANARRYQRALTQRNIMH